MEARIRVLAWHKAYQHLLKLLETHDRKKPRTNTSPSRVKGIKG